MAVQISIVYPMYNEEENIHPAVAEARAVLAPLTQGNYEVIIVNDASSDRTGEMADELAAADPHVRPVHHQVNRTLGGAIRSGFAHSRGDLVLYMDADLPCDLDHIREALPKLQQAHVVVGYRINRHEGVKRWLYTRSYNALVRWLLGVRVRDVNCSFKLLKREVIDALDLHSEGSFIDAEMLAEIRRAGFEIAQIPVAYKVRVGGQSTLARPAVIIKIVSEFRQYLRRRREERRQGGSRG